MVTNLEPSRRAWGVLLLSFSAFCLLCVVLGMSASFFFFRSSVPLEAIIRMGRGTASVTGVAVPAERQLEAADVISTDEAAQGSIFLRDANADNRLVALITMRSNTELTLWRSLRPRFTWGTIGYAVEIVDFQGEIDLLINVPTPHGFVLTLTSRRGDSVIINAPGSYAVRVTDNQLRVVNRKGQVFLKPTSSTLATAIAQGLQGTVNVAEGEGPSLIETQSAPNNLLSAAAFDSSMIATENSQSTSSTNPSPQNWTCADNPNQPPIGAFRLEQQDEQVAMRLVRGEGATSHGDTRCLYYLGATGLDVTPYDYLALRVAFVIHYQSLSVCGTDGSECPLMIRMDYVDQSGTGRIWYHGFYYRHDPEYDYPLQCSSCNQEHENVKANAWYVYDSTNLFRLMPPDQLPASILNLQFYASGHEYDVSIKEFALLASDDLATATVSG